MSCYYSGILATFERSFFKLKLALFLKAMGQSIFCSKSADIHASVIQEREFTEMAIKIQRGLSIILGGGYQKVIVVFHAQLAFFLLFKWPVYLVRPESCFSELSWTYFSCDYSAFHYLALA